MTETGTPDVVVIGGGMGGVSIAAELAVDASVVLLEQEAGLALHATGRSAAGYSQTYGNVIARALTRASRPDFDALEGAHDLPKLLTPQPMLWVADDNGRENLDRLVQSGGLEQLDLRSALDCCPALEPTWLVAAAIDVLSYDIDVLALHQGYVHSFSARGGVIRKKEPVISLTRVGASWRVRTPSSTFDTPLVVNAAGAWADAVARLAHVGTIGLQPFRRTICTSPVQWPDPITAWPFVIDAVGRFYFKPAGSEQVLLSPCDETPMEPGDVRPDEIDVARALDIVNSATRLGLRSVRSSWAGLRSFVADGSPVIGARSQEPGFFWFAAQGGNGISASPALARVGAALARGGDLPPDVQALGVTPEHLSPERLPPSTTQTNWHR